MIKTWVGGIKWLWVGVHTGNLNTGAPIPPPPPPSNLVTLNTQAVTLNTQTVGLT